MNNQNNSGNSSKPAQNGQPSTAKNPANSGDKRANSARDEKEGEGKE